MPETRKDSITTRLSTRRGRATLKRVIVVKSLSSPSVSHSSCMFGMPGTKSHGGGSASDWLTALQSFVFWRIRVHGSRLPHFAAVRPAANAGAKQPTPRRPFAPSSLPTSNCRPRLAPSSRAVLQTSASRRRAPRFHPRRRHACKRFAEACPFGAASLCDLILQPVRHDATVGPYSIGQTTPAS